MATSTKKSSTKKPTAKPEADATVADTPSTTTAVQGVTRAMPTGEGEKSGKVVKKDLIDRVIARSGVKPRYVRPVIDALLVELGEMLEEAETLQLQPLGIVKVQRRKDVDDGEVIITKVKRKKDTPEGDDPLAAAAE
ncbi:MAG: HU family DNA-binding protein [Pseudomonadota bacterium]|nr:HU family DNA-binding protein [Pseudomonadota bacterium]